MCVLLVLGGCASTARRDASAATADGPIAARLFEGMGSHRRAVTTSSREAQRYFDQGLTWAYAFNHDEAARAFARAGELDASCAMAWWGVALVNGPHINNPLMDEQHSKAAYEAWKHASELSAAGHASAVERALIDALGKRYAWPAPTDRAELDKAYAGAMRGVWEKYPNDADVGTLFAESMMDLRPWDLWMQDGTAQPGTEELVGALERVLAMKPEHPGANHLYIHAMEASPRAEKAVAAADRLRAMVPAAGHLVHMPSHIDVRVGRWDKASDANVRAIAADAEYRKLVPRQGFYHVYMAHNRHFLAFSGMMEGRKAVALQAAREMTAGVPEQFIVSAGAMVDPVMGIVLDVQKRFGMWDEILSAAAPDARLPITTTLWRYNRGIALAAKGDLAGARNEQRLMREKAATLPEGAMMAINPAATVLRIADLVLEGEIALAEGRMEDAVRPLREAAGIEDTLRYMEPPDWIQPVRHTLGAVLVKAGRYAEAEGVYREDLKKWPENGWSLLGLSTCLENGGSGRAAELADVKARLKRVWGRSDVEMGSSCACVKGK